MARVTLTTVSNLTGNPTAAALAINNNLTAISAVLDELLSRSDAVNPNTVSQTLDMNSNRLINLPTPVGINDAARLADYIGLTTIGVKTVATLPAAASNAYLRGFVSDATATTFNSTVAGGGANKVPVWSDGTNWKIG